MASVFNHPDARGLLRRTSVCPVPTDGSSNASYALGYTGSNLTTIDKTVDGVTYRKTLGYTGSTLDTVSAWVEQ